jgi:hypothetical protein
MANPFIEGYDSYWNEEDDEKRRRRESEGSGIQTNNPFIQAYEKSFPSSNTAVERKTKPVEQPVPEETKPEKRSLWSRVKEFAASFKAGVPSLTGLALTGTGVAADNKQMTGDLIVSREASTRMLQNYLDQGWWWKGMKKVPLTDLDRENLQRQIDAGKQQVDRIKAREEEEITVSEKLQKKGMEYAEISQKEREKVTEEFGEQKKWSAQWLANEVAFNTPQFIGSFGMSAATFMVTKNPAVALAVGMPSSYVLEAGGAYQTGKQNGLNDYESNKLANLVGLGNMVIEQLPLGKMMNKSPQSKIIKNKVLNNILSWGLNRIEGGLYEGGTETVQELVANAIEKTYNEDKKLFEGLPESGAVGFIMGLVGGGGDESISDTQIVDPKVVDDLNGIVSEALATPAESRTAEQQDIVESFQTQTRVVADEAYKATLASGGVTINLEGNKPSDGYAYSPYKDSETIFDKVSFKENNIAEFIDKFSDRLLEQGNHLGIWEDGGKIYIDISQVGDPNEVTISKAEQAGQLAVFDLKNFATIYTKLGQEQQQGQNEETNISNIPTGEEQRTTGEGVVGIVPEVSETTAGKPVEQKVTPKKITKTQRTVQALEERAGNRTVKFREETAETAEQRKYREANEAQREGSDLPDYRQMVKKESLDDLDFMLMDALAEKWVGDERFAEHKKLQGYQDYLAKQGTKFRTVEEGVVVTKQNFRGLIMRVSKTVPIELVNTDTDDFQVAARDVQEGQTSPSELPLLTTPDGKGKYDIKDGNHRMAEALNRGDEFIEITTEEEIYNKLSDFESGETPPRYTKGKDGKFTGSKTIEETIDDYIDKRGIKLRTKEDELIPTKNSRELTTKFLEHPDIKGKSVLSKSYIQNLSNSKGLGLKAYEYSVIQDVLNKDFSGQDKINGAEFRKAVIRQMLPLEVIPSDTYADYGMGNINLREDSAKTYILNSPYDHGTAGHFSSDFNKSISKEDIEIREVEQNGVKQFVVLDTSVPLNEETIQNAALTITTSREAAESWIEANSQYGEGKMVKARGSVGLFSHFRAGVVDDTAYVVEVQSDAFQKGVGISEERRRLETDIKNLEAMIAKDKADNPNQPEYAYEPRLDLKKKQLGHLPEISEGERVFQTYRNIWQERTIREAINIKAQEGFKKIRFPTPRTVAAIEGFTGGEYGDTMPYEIVSGSEEGLVAGDVISYGGEDYTVLQTDDFAITAAPSDNVNSFSESVYADETVNMRWEDQVRYSFDQIEEKFGKIETIADVEKVLSVNEVLKRLHEYAMIDKDIASENYSWSLDSDTLKTRVENIKRLSSTEGLEEAQERLDRFEADHEDTLKKIKGRKKPTATELKGIPEEEMQKALDPDSYSFGYDIDYELENVFNDAVQNSVDNKESFSLDDIEEDWKQNQLDNFNTYDDLDGIYNEVFSDGNDNVYVVTKGNSESFNQPDQYQKSSSVEDFNIEDFEGEQQTVLSFYDKQVIPYIKKTRSDLVLVDDEQGYQWWESELTEKDKEPPTAYRVKDDLQQIGYEITDEQEQQIIDLNKEFFPDGTSIKIVEQVLGNAKALGAYRDRMIYILSGQANPKDTFYHEAGHKYLDVFTTREEQRELFLYSIRKYKSEDLAQVEENIMEDFIGYAKNRQGVTGKIKVIFDKVLLRIQSFLKNENKILKFYTEVLAPVEVKEAKLKKITKTAQKKATAQKTVAPPVLMKPIGRGDTKISTLGSKVEARAIEAGLARQFADLPEYKEVHVDNQANRAEKMITEDYERAKRIALGQENPPYGLLPESVYKAVELQAEADGSVDLLRQLATSPRVSEATAMGQRIRMLAGRDPDSTVSKIREVADARKKAVEEARGVTVKDEVSKIKKEVDNQVKKISKGDWKSFIDSIEC